jgi:cytochrome c553
VAIAASIAIAAAGAANAAGAIEAGRRKAVACVTCHGENGVATLPNAPNLAGQPELYLAEQLRQFRSGKRPSEVMAVIAKPLSDTDIDDLAAWYAAIRVQATPP